MAKPCCTNPMKGFHKVGLHNFDFNDKGLARLNTAKVSTGLSILPAAMDIVFKVVFWLDKLFAGELKCSPVNSKRLL